MSMVRLTRIGLRRSSPFGQLRCPDSLRESVRPWPPFPNPHDSQRVPGVARGPSVGIDGRPADYREAGGGCGPRQTVNGPKPVAEAVALGLHFPWCQSNIAFKLFDRRPSVTCVAPCTRHSTLRAEYSRRAASD